METRIKYMGYGTNFDAPLGDAYTLAKKYENQSAKIVLLFLSDGTAEYPTKAINKIKNDRGLFAKMGF